MKTHKNLEKDLANLRHQFADGFENRVMEALDQPNQLEQKVISIWSSRVAIAAAACIAFLLISTFVSTGNISTDGLIGLEEYNTIDFNNSYNNITDLYNE